MSKRELTLGIVCGFLFGIIIGMIIGNKSKSYKAPKNVFINDKAVSDRIVLNPEDYD